jgi:hypothetical protein
VSETSDANPAELWDPDTELPPPPDELLYRRWEFSYDAYLQAQDSLVRTDPVLFDRVRELLTEGDERAHHMAELYRVARAAWYELEFTEIVNSTLRDER